MIMDNKTLCLVMFEYGGNKSDKWGSYICMYLCVCVINVYSQ